MPRIRVEPEDFVVEERPLYPPSGEGNHTLLWIEKRLRTTDDVARELARLAGVPPREVGYAGRKDRVGVTRQWFSVPELDPEAARGFELRGARVLEAQRNPHKLRAGQLLGNRFRLKVSDVDETAARQAEERLGLVLRQGLPNRFGRQRFGFGGDNVARGAAILGQQKLRGERRHALLMVAALQSAVFNEVLEARMEHLEQLLQGDVALVHATGGHFVVSDLEKEQPRSERFEISATGPMFGTKMQRPRAAAAALEEKAMKSFDLPPLSHLEVPRGLRVYGGRRPLRVPLDEVRSEWTGDALNLEFVLPAGSYATVLVEELFPSLREETASAEKHPVDDALDDADEAH